MILHHSIYILYLFHDVILHYYYWLNAIDGHVWPTRKDGMLLQRIGLWIKPDSFCREAAQQ